jgi:hypothetical protein
MESRDLLVSIESLEEENLQLKEQLKSSTGNNINSDSKDSQRALIQLQKQYAELEEKYLALKLK